MFGHPIESIVLSRPKLNLGMEICLIEDVLEDVEATSITRG